MTYHPQPGAQLTVGVYTTWMDDAECRGHLHLFDLPKPPRRADRTTDAQQRRSRRHGQIMQCRTICAACPVIDRCRQWALHPTNPAYEMFAAGMTPEERKAQR